jgi:hypothetical protein
VFVTLGRWAVRIGHSKGKPSTAAQIQAADEELWVVER